jgi:DNA-3-methyladenine glycosylase II
MSRGDTPGAEAREAVARLSSTDQRLAAVIAGQGPINPYLWEGVPVERGDLLSGLVVHILGQQITTVLALRFFEQLKTLLGGQIDALRLSQATIEQLREIGLSGAKARALRELGEKVVAGFSLEELLQLGDEDAQVQLVALRGIGPWSAQMFLLHELRRPDIFPAGDLGLRAAVARLDLLPAPPDIPATVARAAGWSPYRSYAAAYLWQWLRQLRSAA